MILFVSFIFNDAIITFNYICDLHYISLHYISVLYFYFTYANYVYINVNTLAVNILTVKTSLFMCFGIGCNSLRIIENSTHQNMWAWNF